MRQNISKTHCLLFFLIFVLTLTCFIKSNITIALENGLARTPPMGWSSWNKFGLNIDETIVKQIADTIVTSGMKDCGYTYINIDDGWMASSRDGNGNLTANSADDLLYFRGYAQCRNEY